MIRAALVAAALAASVLSAAADDFQYEPRSDVIFHGASPVQQWYNERPSLTKRRVRVPDHIHACRHRFCGYPLPIHKAPRRLAEIGPPVAVVERHAHGHDAWCARRYRSFDVHTNTWQPRHGARRICRSPW